MLKGRNREKLLTGDELRGIKEDSQDPVRCEEMQETQEKEL